MTAQAPFVMITAPAKINLYLGVHPERDERGYHKVDSVMTCIDLADAASYHYNLFSFKCSFYKFHGCSFCHLMDIHSFFKRCYLFFHCSDNSCLHALPPSILSL